MRIDKLLTSAGICSRTEASKAARAGRICVNGGVAKDLSCHIDPSVDTVTLDGEEIIFREHVYIMLNKPDGYISATDDPREKTVLELLPSRLKRRGLFPCGRLDKDTLGLLILTDDGPLSHRLTSPNHHAEKVYRFIAADPVADLSRLESGVTLDDGYTTKPAVITLTDADRGLITLTEGKYHQIKRMFAAVGNRITYLERVSFGGVELDPSLPRGEWRFLSADEEERLGNGDAGERGNGDTGERQAFEKA